MVVALDSMPFLSLNCFILGDDPNQMFTVKIPKNKNISILKGLIKEKNTCHFEHVDASDLELWQVSFPVDDLRSKIPPVGSKLRSEELLSDMFPSELDPKHIHVVATNDQTSHGDAEQGDIVTELTKRTRDHRIFLFAYANLHQVSTGW
jgi:hypothetical protein